MSVLGVFGWCIQHQNDIQQILIIIVRKNMNIKNYTVASRFLKYVTVDTQSDTQSTSFPSTEKQKNLAKILVDELLEMGVADAHMDEWGYVYATIPSNSDKINIPVICFCSHMDTSPDCSGLNVKPIVHKNYDGRDLVLPADNSIVLRLKEQADLKNQMGVIVVDVTQQILKRELANKTEQESYINKLISEANLN